ncbi:hypothetical protein EJ06DRAFT_551469 [Trichodelitschia bisporula]|uniref:Alpha/beta-hydrolase n=1 Tax=Trichodelitschia bisporula TaxID=703511 RepID=A0A6G1HLR7_9PEZI|nr:hypothetical protein EJ06DRAFT_551469 [Trichodelitschia bisporula]
MRKVKLLPALVLSLPLADPFLPPLPTIIPTLLSLSANSTVINLLLPTPNHPHATHATLAAWDFLSPRNSRPIGLAGCLTGGSLAAALALTEARPGSSGIRAVALSSPVTDWLFPELPAPGNWATLSGPTFRPATAPPPRSIPKGQSYASFAASLLARPSAQKQSRAKEPPLTSWDAHATGTLSPSALHALRRTLFARPSGAFDPFASPVHFLRSEGAVPAPGWGWDPRAPPGPPPSSSIGNFAEDWDAELPPTVEWETEGVEVEVDVPARRRVPRTWPPPGSGVCVPRFRVSTGANVLRDSNVEFVGLVRRAFAGTEVGRTEAEREAGRMEGDGGDDEGWRRAVAKAAEEWVRLEEEGSGIWGGGEGWEADVERAGKWLGDVLRR